MDAPLVHAKIKKDAATRPIAVSETAPGANEAGESAGDADRMLRMIVGSICLDPQAIQRELNDQASHDAAGPDQDLSFGLVVLAAALVCLLFAFDLFFMKG